MINIFKKIIQTLYKMSDELVYTTQFDAGASWDGSCYNVTGRTVNPFTAKNPCLKCVNNQDYASKMTSFPNFVEMQFPPSTGSQYIPIGLVLARITRNALIFLPSVQQYQVVKIRVPVVHRSVVGSYRDILNSGSIFHLKIPAKRICVPMIVPRFYLGLFRSIMAENC
jgi:hypothetical protein